MATPTIDIPSSAAAFEAALEGLTALDEWMLNQKRYPALYSAGVRYKKEPRDIWRHVEDVAREKWGDCEDLAAWRAAELRHSGEDRAAHVVTYKTGEHTYHAVVKRGSGIIEDPSRVLGMPISDMAAYNRKLAMAFGDSVRTSGPDAPQIMMGEDPTPDNRSLTFDIYHTGRGWAGVIRLPFGTPGEAAKAIFMQTSTSETPTQAAQKATNLAKLVEALPADIRNKIPPQAQAAVSVLTNPTVVKALKNPASLLNMTTALARPDIAVQNVQKAASFVKDLFG